MAAAAYGVTKLAKSSDDDDEDGDGESKTNASTNAGNIGGGEAAGKTVPPPKK